MSNKKKFHFVLIFQKKTPKNARLLHFSTGTIFFLMAQDHSKSDQVFHPVKHHKHPTRILISHTTDIHHHHHHCTTHAPLPVHSASGFVTSTRKHWPPSTVSVDSIALITYLPCLLWSSVFPVSLLVWCFLIPHLVIVLFIIRGFCSKTHLCKDNVSGLCSASVFIRIYFTYILTCLHTCHHFH